MNSTSETAQFFRFADGKLNAISETGIEVKLAVADSWLVESGRTRNLKAHFERFSQWVSSVDESAVAQLDDFFEAVVAEIPATENWFPRIELHTEAPLGQRLHFRLRVAPEIQPSLLLWAYGEADVRVNPLIKGPDLSFGMQLRRHAKLHGADEAVFLTNKGFINEGALSSLVWWRGDVLCSTSAEGAKWLPSITREEVFGIARDCGFETNLELATPQALQGLEVWALSSLQGIRPARGILLEESLIEFAKPIRAEGFQKRLRLLSSNIH